MDEQEKTMEQSMDELEERLEEETEKAGGRESLIRRFAHETVKLSRPFQWCGKTYEELDMDFEGLTGRDMEAIDDEIGAMGLRGSRRPSGLRKTR